MTNTEYVQKIRAMGITELLAEIIEHAEYLTDSYYREFGRALVLRAQELITNDPVAAERERCAKIVEHEIAMGIYDGLHQQKTDAMEERVLRKIRSGG